MTRTRMALTFAAGVFSCLVMSNPVGAVPYTPSKHEVLVDLDGDNNPESVTVYHDHTEKDKKDKHQWYYVPPFVRVVERNGTPQIGLYRIAYIDDREQEHVVCGLFTAELSAALGAEALGRLRQRIAEHAGQPAQQLSISATSMVDARLYFWPGAGPAFVQSATPADGLAVERDPSQPISFYAFVTDIGLATFSTLVKEGRPLPLWVDWKSLVLPPEAEVTVRIEYDKFYEWYSTTTTTRERWRRFFVFSGERVETTRQVKETMGDKICVFTEIRGTRDVGQETLRELADQIAQRAIERIKEVCFKPADAEAIENLKQGFGVDDVAQVIANLASADWVASVAGLVKYFFWDERTQQLYVLKSADEFHGTFIQRYTISQPELWSQQRIPAKLLRRWAGEVVDVTEPQMFSCVFCIPAARNLLAVSPKLTRAQLSVVAQTGRGNDLSGAFVWNRGPDGKDAHWFQMQKGHRVRVQEPFVVFQTLPGGRTPEELRRAQLQVEYFVEQEYAPNKTVALRERRTYPFPESPLAFSMKEGLFRPLEIDARDFPDEERAKLSGTLWYLTLDSNGKEIVERIDFNFRRPDDAQKNPPVESVTLPLPVGTDGRYRVPKTKDRPALLVRWHKEDGLREYTLGEEELESLVVLYRNRFWSKR